MSLACPSCRQPILVKAPKPGRFKITCAKCERPFALIVADDLSMNVGALGAQTPLGVTTPGLDASPAPPPSAPPPVAKLLSPDSGMDHLPATRIVASEPAPPAMQPPPLPAAPEREVPEV